jgi:hypothetical protein
MAQRAESMGQRVKRKEERAKNKLAHSSWLIANRAEGMEHRAWSIE